MKKGVFITFEGGEGSGKTTLIQKIEKQLLNERHSVIVTREPGGTELGEKIRFLLLHEKGKMSPYAELSLFLASRAQHVAQIIQPALHAGKIVLCDRFNDSTIAYQGAARNLGVDSVALFCKWICHDLEPDLTVYLDVDPRVGLLRAQKDRAQDRIEAEDLAFHQKIRQTYLHLAQKYPERIHIVDAQIPVDAVFQQAMTLVEELCLKQS